MALEYRETNVNHSRQIMFSIAYVTATVKVSLGVVYLLGYLIFAPDKSIIMHRSPAMTFDSALNFVFGGVTLLLILWIISHQDKMEDLRRTNNRLAQALTETTLAPEKPTKSQED